MTKISVIIPSYNDEKTIGPCLDSILNQDYSDYEILVCLDSKTNDSTEIIVKERKGVRLVLCKGKSKMQVVKEGFRISKGDIICVMDSDIIVDKDFLRKGYECMEKFDIIGSLVSSINAGLQFVPSVRAFLWKRKDERGNFVTTGGSDFYTREAFRKKILPRPAEDPDLIVPVEFLEMEEIVKERPLKVSEISETDIRYLLRKSYQAGVRDALAMKFRRKEAVSFLIFSLFPVTMGVLALTYLFIPLILLTCAYLAENFLYVMRFQREFKRPSWTFKLFFLRPIMHAYTSLGTYRGLVRLIHTPRSFE